MKYLLQKKYYVIIILVILMMLSLIYPVRYNYMDKTEMLEPDVNTYDEALFRLLPEKIINKAKAKGLRNYTDPVIDDNGPDNSMPYLVTDINIALSMYDGWNIRLDKKQEQKITTRINERVKVWKFSGDILGRIIKGHKEAIIKTKYWAESSWRRTSVSDSDNILLTLIIYEYRNRTKIFTVKVSFMENELINQMKNKVLAYNNKIKDLKIKADISRNIFSGLSVLLVAFAMLIGGDYFYQRIYIKKYQDNLVKDIPKLQELADNGHFVTALELADKIIEQFPEHFETKAFRERVLDFTNNDPKQAQIAFVEAKKLELRLQMFQKNPQDALLHAKEKENLIPLLPYHTGLQTSYNLLVAKEEEREREEQFQTELNDFEKMIDNGMLEKAKEMLHRLENYNLNTSDISNLKVSFQKKEENALQQLKSVNTSLRSGNIRETKQLLSEFLSSYPDNPRGLELQNQFSSSSGSNKIRLQSKNDSAQIFIYFQDEIIIGRRDKNIHLDIELDDRRISRPHASIELLEDHVILKDLNSTGGTFVNGKKILTQSLENEDRITLAKVVDFEVRTPRTLGKNENGICLIHNKDQYLLVKSNLSFDFSNFLIQFSDPKYAITHDEELTIFTTPTSTYILREDIEIELGDETFTVEII